MKRKLDSYEELLSKKARTSSTIYPLKDRLFSSLSPDEYQQYVEEKQKHLDECWNFYQEAKTNKDYETAGWYFEQMLMECYERALNEFTLKSDQSNKPQEGTDFFANPAKNYYKGLAYRFGWGIAQSYEKALAFFTKAAEQGYVLAINQVGFCYSQGEGVERDPNRAFSYYKQAAEQGLALAQCNLAGNYKNGWGTPIDLNQVITWYRKAAEQGLALAQCNLAVNYENGWGTPIDLNQAITWYQKAAEQGLAKAQYFMGMRYKKGVGVTINLNKALFYFKQSAEQGDAYAQAEMSAFYLDDKAGIKDVNLGFIYAKKSADQGNYLGQFGLGFCYRWGFGVPENLFQAIIWLKKAALQKYTTAKNELKNIATPFSLYTLAWCEQDLASMAENLLISPEAKTLFIEEDLYLLTTYFTQEQLKEFITFLARKEDIRYSFVLKCLLILDEKTRNKPERTAEHCRLMTLLLEGIDFAFISPEQIEPLANFLYNLYLDLKPQEESSKIIDGLIALWRRAQQFKQIELFPLNKLLASLLVSHYFKGGCQIAYDSRFSQRDMNLLISAYEEPELPFEATPSLQKKILLAITPELLTRLYNCITHEASIKATPLFDLLKKTITSYGNELFDKTFCKLCFDKLIQITASDKPGLFTTPLQTDEKKLAQILRKGDVVELVQWIEDAENRRANACKVNVC